MSIYHHGLSRIPGWTLPFIIVILAIAVEALDWLTPFYSLDRWGIISWSLWHTPGIVLMPLLHDGWVHLFANLPAFLILGTLLAVRGQLIHVALIGTLGTGLAIWLWPFGSGVHVGASGLILCMFGYAFLRSIRPQSWIDMTVTTAVILFYGVSMWATVTNFSPGISWQGHVFGLLTGFALAWFQPDFSSST